MGSNGKKKALTMKQQSFVDQYMIYTGNGTKAYKMSKYADCEDTSAATEASKLLRKPLISEAIARRREKEIKEFKWDYNEIVKEDIAIATIDPTLALELRQGSLIPPNELPEHVRKAIAGVDVIESHAKGGTKLIKYKYRFWDKGAAIERFTKRIGGYEADNRQKGLDADAIQLITGIINALPPGQAALVWGQVGDKLGTKLVE